MRLLLPMVLIPALAATGCGSASKPRSGGSNRFPEKAWPVPGSNPDRNGNFQIEAYRPVFEACFPKGDDSTTPMFGIRRFSSRGRGFLLLVDSETFQTRIVDAGEIDARTSNPEQWTATPFIRQLLAFTTGPSPLQDAGFVHAVNQARHPVLTVDLCPSVHPFEKRLFEALVESRLPKPVPLAVCVSGGWMVRHPTETEWLKGLVGNGKLDIAWVNHTFHHHYAEGVPLERNFLLAPGIDLDDEVLETERTMIEKGLTPAAFLRFPGLVSNAADLLKLRRLSLIPLGSDAWLAKGGKVEPGGIILIHGNGNEPLGVDLFLNRLKSLEGLEPLTRAVVPDGNNQ